MAEVGVLQLTIQDNSESAAAGLEKLVSVLERVKSAVNSQLNLSGLSNKLAKLSKTVNDEIHGSTIAKLSELADSLKKLKDAGGSLSALGKIGKMEELASASDKVADLKENLQSIKSVGEITVPVKTVVDDHLSTIYLNEKGNLMGNTPDIPALTEKYKAFPKQTIEDLYNGTRWTVDKETGIREQVTNQNDLMAQWLHGQGTEREQYFAIQEAARITGTSIEDVKQKIAELSGVAAQARERMQSLFDQHYYSGTMESVQQQIDSLLGVGSTPKDAKESMQAFIDGMKGMDSVAATVRELNPELATLNEKTEQTSFSMKDLKERIGELEKTSKKGIFNGLLSSFGRLIKYRALRYVIRSITSGFSEGLENVYNYSKAINGSFAPSMDSAASAMAQFKNSIGAAAAPLVQALIPYVNMAVNALITLTNWINQFVALLRGQSTWTRALTQSASAFDKQKKAAKGAGAAIKDLLADWDELNIIQSESGSGGGASAAAEDYLKMFEEVGEFDNRIKKITDFIKDNLDDVWRIAKGIGAAILAWKVSNMFTGFIGDLAALAAAGIVIGVAWDITFLTDHQYMKTGDPGWLVADALTNLLGATLAGGIVAKVLGGAAGLVTAGIELTVSAGISYGVAYANAASDQADALKKLSAIKAAIGYAAMAVGFGIASGSAGIGLLAAAVVAAPLFTLSAAVAIVVEQYRTAEEIAREAFSGTGKNGIKVDEVFKALQDELDKATAGYSLVIEAFSGAGQLKTDLGEAFETVTMLSATVKGDGKLTQEEAEAFSKAWTTVFDAFEGLTATSFDTVFAGLNKSLSSENEEIRKQAKELRVSMLMIKENISETMAEFRLEQEELAEKVGKGTATPEELDQYFKNLELVSKYSKNSLTDFESIVAGSANIDFGNPTEAVDNAVKYIQDVNSASQTALAEIDEAYKSEMESLDMLWRDVELSHDLGKISDEQYEAYKGIFDATRKNFTDAANEERNKVKSTVQSAYMSVIDQALGGIASIPGVMDEYGHLDAIKVAAYMTEIMLPILSAAQDAGVEFSEDFGKMFGIGVNMQDWIGEGWVTKLSDYIKEIIDNPENKPETPKLDNSALDESIKDAQGKVQDMADNIKASIASLEGLGFSFNTSTGESVTGNMSVRIPTSRTIAAAANGGLFRSGDIFSANENGQAEMIGSYGNKTAVVNNDQIISGITAGVATGNAEVVSALNTLINAVQKQGNRPIEVKLTPNSSWGAHVVSSTEAYSRVTGV